MENEKNDIDYYEILKDNFDNYEVKRIIFGVGNKFNSEFYLNLKEYIFKDLKGFVQQSLKFIINQIKENIKTTTLMIEYNNRISHDEIKYNLCDSLLRTLNIFDDYYEYIDNSVDFSIITNQIKKTFLTIKFEFDKIYNQYKGNYSNYTYHMSEKLEKEIIEITPKITNKLNELIDTLNEYYEFTINKEDLKQIVKDFPFTEKEYYYKIKELMSTKLYRLIRHMNNFFFNIKNTRLEDIDSMFKRYVNEIKNMKKYLYEDRFNSWYEYKRFESTKELVDKLEDTRFKKLEEYQQTLSKKINDIQPGFLIPEKFYKTFIQDLKEIENYLNQEVYNFIYNELTIN